MESEEKIFWQKFIGSLIFISALFWFLMVVNEWKYQLFPNIYSGVFRCFAPSLWEIYINTYLALILGCIGIQTFRLVVTSKQAIFWSLFITLLWFANTYMYHHWLYEYDILLDEIDKGF